MGMELEERPLLHFPDLILEVLRAAGAASATLDDAADRLARHRRRAREPADVPRSELLAHLEVARRHAAAAQLIEMVAPGRFRITPRGRAALHRHPDGIDDSILMDFPEFRAWLERTRPARRPEDTRHREFQRGFAAFDEKCDLTDNPFATETAQHAAWEDGWLEAHSRRREQGRKPPDQTG